MHALSELQQDALLEIFNIGVALLDIPHAYTGGKPYVTISIGLATRHGNTPLGAAALIRAADRALYEAKHDGRDRVIAVSGDL